MRRRPTRGGSLIEAVVAAIFLIPIVLGMLDLVVMVMSSMDNDELAKNAARAAASQPDQNTSYQAALNVVNRFKTSNTITSVNMDDFKYTQNDSILVATKMKVCLPVEVAGWGHLTFVAQSVQPIVAPKQ